MSNPDSGEVTWMVRDTPYTLVLRTAALSALQKRLSPAGQIIPLDQLLVELKRASDAQSVEHVVLLLWAALQKHHKGITEDQVIDLIDESGGIASLSHTLAALDRASAPDPEDVKELSRGANPPKARTRKAHGAGETSRSVPA